MRIIITERQYDDLFYKRRLNNVEDNFLLAIGQVDPYQYNLEDYTTEVIWSLANHYAANNEMFQGMFQFLKKMYQDRIEIIYNKAKEL